MVKLRLARFGKKKQPTYRVVAVSARSKRNTMALEYLGSYNPFDNKNKFSFNKERVQYWLDNGAKPTYTVKSLLIKDGFLKADIKKRPVVNEVSKNSSKEKVTVTTEKKTPVQEATAEAKSTKPKS